MVNIELWCVCVSVSVSVFVCIWGGGVGDYGAAVGRWTVTRFWCKKNSVGYPYCCSMASV